jgi:CHAT domain-containing protein
MKAAIQRATLILIVATLACRERRQDAPSAAKRAEASDTSDARVLLARGDSTYGRQEYDSASSLFRRAADRAARASDTLTEARALTQLGLAAWHRGDYDAARDAGEQAVTLKVKAGLTKELAKSYNALGLLSHNQGRFADALAQFGRAEDAATEIGDSAGVAKARGNRGLVHSDIGDFLQARTEIDYLRRFAHARNDTVQEAKALDNLGMVDIRAGEPRKALGRLAVARKYFRAIALADGEENVLGQTGTAYKALGETQIALVYLDSALNIAHSRGFRQQESDDLQLIAELYQEAGDYARSLDFLARAAPLADSMGMRKIQGDIARAQSRALIGLGNIASARARATAATRFHADAGALLEQLEDELLLAELAEKDHLPREADGAIAVARSLARSIDSRVSRVELALGEARVAELRGRPNDVLQALARVRNDAGEPAGPDWESPALAARAYARLGRTREAEQSGREAVHAIERLRGGIGSGTLRVSFTAARAGVYADLVLTLLRLGKTTEALAVADGARSRALLEHLGAAGSDSTQRQSASDLISAEQLLRRIDRLLEQLRLADTTSPRRRTRFDAKESGFLARQLADAQEQYETLMRRAGIEDRWVSAITGNTLPNGTDIRRSLAPGEALIEYLITDSRLITFVVTPETVRALQTAVSEDAVSSQVRVARGLLSRRDEPSSTRDPVLRGLYQTLIGPVAGAGLLRGIRTLVVVPHASLSYLSFAALTNPVTGRYLIQDFNLLVEPSAASLVAARAPAKPASVATAMNVFAPFPDELPGSQAEADAVTRAIPSSRALVGQDATERALRVALATTGPVHVATHGILNSVSPMFTRLEVARPPVAPGVDAPTEDDGRLEVHELLGLNIRSPLVFLSGCETGAGPAWSTSFARGDDYATLAEAFLFAGARNVISTLWRIEDRGAAVFATAFYGGAAGRNPAEALGNAQRRMLTDSQYASPYYWAAYVATGEGLSLDSATTNDRVRVITR